MKKTGIMPVALQHQNYSGEAMPVDLLSDQILSQNIGDALKKKNHCVLHTDSDGQKRTVTDKNGQ